MDTPDKSTALPSPSSFLSKFEDSPVFNYISTLSPIKPFSLGHSTQPFHLNFSSPQALQTPPTSYPREPKITSASHVSEVPKNSFSQDCSDGKNAEMSAAIEPADLEAEEVEKIDRKEAVSTTDKSLKLLSEITKSLKYGCDSPENNGVHCDAVETHCELNVAGAESFPVKVNQGDSKEVDCSFENEMDLQGIQSPFEQNKEVCEWENFVSEASDTVTNENYHDELDDRSAVSGMLSFVATVLQPPNEHISDPQKVDPDCPIISENHNMEVSTNKSGEIGNLNERSQIPAESCSVLAKEPVHFLKTEINDESCSQQQQTTRRRCLVYEMSGSHYRKLLTDSTGSSPNKPGVNSSISNDKFLMASRPGGNKFTSALPGIGLHLNALAAAAKNKIIVKSQNLTCRRQLISSPCTTSSDSLVSNAKSLATQIAPAIVKREPEEQIDGFPSFGDVSENPIFSGGFELPQSSPKKKRQKTESAGELDSCKRCNCKRSKCLKLYCECFAAGLYCVEPCNCHDCFNKPIHEETVLETRQQIESRNPLAFAPKVIKCSGTPISGEELNKTPASSRHKRGCNCKKSGCLKKYCECFQGGVGCSLSCRCEGCKNTFGRKEGAENFVFQETKFLHKNASDVSSHDNAPKTYEEDYNEATPEPSTNARQLVRQPFQFSMAPCAPMLCSEPVLQSCTSQNNDNSDQMFLEEDHKTAVPEDDTSEALKGEYLLPTTCVKSASPNCKRISSPHCDFETSPGWRSCRKLILRSISSIPASTPEKESMQLTGKLQEEINNFLSLDKV